jgi:hypothetical protein
VVARVTQHMQRRAEFDQSGHHRHRPGRARSVQAHDRNWHSQPVHQSAEPTGPHSLLATHPATACSSAIALDHHPQARSAARGRDCTGGFRAGAAAFVTDASRE